jgi:hypothetical protein
VNYVAIVKELPRLSVKMVDDLGKRGTLTEIVPDVRLLIIQQDH